MYLEWDGENQKMAQAQLISPPIKSTSDFCMSFFYRTFHNTRGVLNVYQRVENTEDSPLQIQLKYNENDWVKAQVTLPVHESYKVSRIYIMLCRK